MTTPFSRPRPPALFSAWAAEPDQMPAGAPGKLGVLRLGFRRQHGTTRLADNYATGPQRVQRALHLDPALPAMAFAIIQSVSGGVLQGDRLTVKVRVETGAQAHVTTQAATKIYRMDRNYATQHIALTVQPGGYLEYLPDFVIPYRTARFYQETELTVADDATLVLSELIAPGRVASGEVFRFDAFCAHTQARDDHGRLRFTDLIRLEPRRTPPNRPGLLSGYRYYASLWVLTRRTAADRLVAAMRGAVDAIDAAVAGVSVLPHEDGAVLRAIGTTGSAVQGTILSAWSAVRLLLLGAPAPHLQRIKYGFQPAPLLAVSEQARTNP